MKVIRRSAAAWISAGLLVALHSFSALAGPRAYDLNILLEKPHPFADGALSSPPPTGSQVPARRAAAGEAKGSGTSDKKDRYSTHNYTWRLLPAAWFVFVEGEYGTENSLGRSVSVTLNGDLGYDDPYPTFNGEASFRWGKHDFWITGLAFDQSESAPINVEFQFEGETFDVGGVVDSEVSITDINFRYGYSFFEFEEDGFRLGPTVAVSYTVFSVALTELTIAGIPTGARFSFEDTLPIPTIGVHGEVPYGNFLYSAQFGGFYFDSSGFEGTGIRAQADVTWRPYDNVGFFAGLKAIYADLEFKNEELNDLLLWGPAVGVEFRF